MGWARQRRAQEPLKWKFRLNSTHRWWQVPAMAKHTVATVDEIPPGGGKIVDLEGRSVGIFNVAGEFYAIRNTCPHQGGPLCGGVLTGFAISDEPGTHQYVRCGEVIRCSWHGWEFDIKTGTSWVDPKRIRVKRYPVTVQEVRLGVRD